MSRQSLVSTRLVVSFVSLGVAGLALAVALGPGRSSEPSASEPEALPRVSAMSAHLVETEQPGSFLLEPNPLALADYGIGSRPRDFGFTEASFLPQPTPLLDPGAALTESALWSDEREESSAAPASPPAASEKPVGSPWPRVERGRLAAGETLASALRNQGVAPRTIYRIVEELRPIFDFRHAQPGHRYSLTLGPGGELVDFRYSTDSEHSYHLFREQGQLVVRSERASLRTQTKAVRGRVQTSLYDAIRDASGSAQLAADFAQLFNWEIDFSRGVHTGDEFQILFEGQYQRDGSGADRLVRPVRILAARYQGISGTHEIVYFDERSDDRDENSGAVRGYYRPDGSALERQFLSAPVDFSRIASGFSASRRHPILKITRPHHGIDYAAPLGAPVWAVADGTIIYRGWAGGFGKLIKIRHQGGYVSFYGHLSGFEAGLEVGDRVDRKQRIGRVGKTGLATGPHVCFRVSQDGRFIDPMKVETPNAPGLSGPSLARFETARDRLLSRLNAIGMVASLPGDDLL